MDIPEGSSYNLSMINKWLDTFKDGWVTKNIDQVLGLFTDDVEYWETPYKQVENKGTLRQEWEGILEQEDIQLKLEVYSSFGNKHTVIWDLSYKNGGSLKEWAGTYLIELDDAGLCIYFHQTGEKR